MPGYQLQSFSFSKQAGVVDFCEKTLALELVQDSFVLNHELKEQN